ncbi:MAG: hypothetical protein K8T90_18420 [Planctomycetes bacterium]|nr:hypothetical protein [Planctomycetota bacterium]
MPNASPHERIEATLRRARAALPASASAYATENPRNPDSIATLAYFEELLEQRELEVAVYALAEIAHGTRAGDASWSAIDEAARIMNFDAQQRARAFLR